MCNKLMNDKCQQQLDFLLSWAFFRKVFKALLKTGNSAVSVITISTGISAEITERPIKMDAAKQQSPISAYKLIHSLSYLVWIGIHFINTFFTGIISAEGTVISTCQ